MSLQSLALIPFSLLCLIAVVQGQSSTASSTTITGSVTGTAITEPTTVSRSSSAMSSGTASSGSASLSVSSTLSAALPSLSGYSTCVTNCLQLAIAYANCTSVADVDCYCGTTIFPASLTGCISSDCSDQLSTSESLSQQFCNLASPSTSLSFSVTSISSSAAMSSTSVGTTTPTGTSSTSTKTTSSSTSSRSVSSVASASSNAALGRTVVAISSSAFWAVFAFVLGILFSGATVS
ncbi:uncharacterized protein BT62DRAFT_937303 [Guyanagaster necrorhizus]|uniref:CFEM domain-containing protein n=1 Tax=Guyanagaster necrorhizus TaxID=856835 RepID=A0A9P7VIR5_9AGAR|nr:uncharacterized protein BT62DRAFT_937303 [Guyanagaster necrorhizus MCA 3950]KAG7441267.1 hypothetical protein BT62DRAFT_937303 [Guyanagaster necrorhizus MCA 3950]